MSYGHFDDPSRAYVVTDPKTPRPWINYLGNRKLQAFISQNAGGMLWYLETEYHRLTRYHYTASPRDRPGFYVYVKDRRTGRVWNPHFAPTCTPLDRFECRHTPGITRFVSCKDNIEAAVDYVIPLGDNVLLWKVTATNLSDEPADLQFASYVEFGLLERLRKWWWCYLRYHSSLRYDADARCIRYDYNAFEAFHAPRMVVGCTGTVNGYECSRDAFTGPGGSLENPEALKTDRGFTGSELPVGGHGCGVLATDLTLSPGEPRQFAYIFAMADDWSETDALLEKYSRLPVIDAAIDAQRDFWEERLSVLTAETGDDMVDRFVNTWNPYHSLTISALPCSISTDHQGIDGQRYRDGTQYALAPANLDPEFATARMELIFATQKRDGMAPRYFRPHTPVPPGDEPRRSDNTVWPIYTVKNLVEETGDLSILERVVPFRDGGEGTFYDHILLGLKWIYEHRGPQGMPLLLAADWNDCLQAWCGEETESVMLGMQLAYACREFRELALRLGRDEDVAWCTRAVDELLAVINSDVVWGGRWYRRLLLAGGRSLGNEDDREGRIWINAQTWSVICGAGEHEGRGELAMQSAHEHLDTKVGLSMQWPAFGSSRLESGERFSGARPGVGEYGGIFNHTNTWAIIAEALLGHHDRAFDYYRRILPAVVSETVGPDHYLREPYVYVSAVVGPASAAFGQGGISWITGTAPWMYIAATQYILGVKPTLDGLRVRPCLPSSMKSVRVRRRFRGCLYDLHIDNARRAEVRLEVNGKALPSDVIGPQRGPDCEVHCFC